MVFELCVESLEPCLMARAAGAARLELCSALRLDGLSPAPELVREVVACSGLPVHVMVRPRAGDFVCSPADVEAMEAEMERGLTLGVAGFVLGALLPDGTVDAQTTRRLVRCAAGRQVTFHRAFDVVPDQIASLEVVIDCGCERVLTSGGAPNVFAGREQIRRLVRAAGGRLEVAAGGGLRAEQATEVARVTGAGHFHGTARRQGAPDVTPADVAAMVAALQTGAALAGR